MSTERTIDQQRADLEAEVERIRARREAVTASPTVPEGVSNVASAMPEIVAKMERARAHWLAFCDSVRPQFDALPETKSCQHHPAVARPKLFEDTCQQTRVNGSFTPAWAPCPECTSEAARSKVRAFWSRRGVPGRILEATLSNFDTDTEERVDALGKVIGWTKANGAFLLLVGTPGTGKGHLAVGCLKAQGNGLFITHGDMLSDLRASYTLHTTKDLTATWQEAEMLVLDEFGLSPGGKDEEPMLYQVLAKRYEERRPTVITSNLALDDFRTAIGYRLLDRISEQCQTVICRWPSRRTGK